MYCPFTSEKRKHKHLKTNPIQSCCTSYLKNARRKKLEPIQSCCTSYLKNAKRKKIGTNPIQVHIIFEKRKTKKYCGERGSNSRPFTSEKTKHKHLKTNPIQSCCTSYLKNAKRKKKIGTNPILLHNIFGKRKTKKYWGERGSNSRPQDHSH